MGDLISGQYQYSDLVNRYGNFQVPTYKIKADGNEISGPAGAFVTSIEITLSLEYASCAVIHLAGAYDAKKRAFSSSLKKSFSLGAILEIELGYLSAHTKIFKGYISSVLMNVSENPVFIITAMDVRKLMMDSRYKERYFNDTNYSDMVSKVMNDYKGLCSVECDSSNDKLNRNIYQKGSDYEFIVNVLGRRMNKEFFVLGDKAYFRTHDSLAAEVMTLEYGLGLLSFTKRSNYLDLSIVTVSYDKAETKSVKSEIPAKNKELKSPVLSNPSKEVFVQCDLETVEELKTANSFIAEDKIRKARIGSGRCIGLPEIVPGRYIKIKKTDSGMDGKYYITQVKHSLGENGFQTEFQTEG